jgi:hypothetical protein
MTMQTANRQQEWAETATATISGQHGWWLAAGVALISFLVYLVTMPPGLTFEHYGTDGGDLVSAARTLGVPHPTGYPVYTLLAWLFSHLPVGSIAYRANLLSSMCAAGAVALLCRTVQALEPHRAQSRLVAAATGLTLAFSSLLWSQAIIAEVYALLTLFAALLLWFLVRWRQTGNRVALWAAALTLGLGLGNHLTLALAAPAALFLLFEKRSPASQAWYQPHILLPGLALFLAGLSVYGYLPLAARQWPPVNWGNPQTWPRFWWLVSGKQYQPFAFALTPADMPRRLALWAALLGDQSGWWGLALSFFGGWVWWQRDRRFCLFCLSWILLLAFYAFFYDTHDSHVYMLPASLLLALGWAAGTGYLLDRVPAKANREGTTASGPIHTAGNRSRIYQQLSLALLLGLPAVSLGLHWRAADLSDDRLVPTYIEQVFIETDPGAVILVRSDRPTFALWYAVYAEGQRPDVAIVSGPLLAYVWYREHVRHHYPDLIVNEPAPDDDVTIDDLVCDLIAQNLAHRPIFATDPSDAWQADLDFIPQGLAPIYRAQYPAP